jgi:arylsulfatase A-like enzyme
MIPEPVALLDVAPTVLDVAGLPIPRTFEGRSLSALIAGLPADATPAGSPSAQERTLFFDTPNTELAVHGLLRGRWKLIRNGAAGTSELYDLAADPSERHDLAAVRSDVREPLERDLAAWVTEMESTGQQQGWFAVPQSEPGGEDAERLEQLRALGYVR